jgi:hypothetical protein
MINWHGVKVEEALSSCCWLFWKDVLIWQRRRVAYSPFELSCGLGQSFILLYHQLTAYHVCSSAPHMEPSKRCSWVRFYVSTFLIWVLSGKRDWSGAPKKGWGLARKGWGLAKKGWGLAKKGWGLAKKGITNVRPRKYMLRMSKAFFDCSRTIVPLRNVNVLKPFRERLHHRALTER